MKKPSSRQACPLLKIVMGRGSESIKMANAKPKTIVLTGYGINCDEETRYAFELAGSESEIVHINDLIDGVKKLRDCQILAFPGGFSYGDDTGSGKALANRSRNNLFEELQDFLQKDNLAIGICNGFQVMVNLGILPALEGYVQIVALAHNTTARYECRWVSLIKSSGKSSDECIFDKCIFTKGIDEIELPVAHGEGKFYAPENILRELNEKKLIVLRYAKDGKTACGEFPFNPNGSLEDIAGICDESGRIFGLMPHPERYIDFTHHPFWTLEKEKLKREKKPLPKEGAGLQIFRNAVAYFR